MNDFVAKVVDVYKKEFSNFGFIPSTKLQYYYDRNRFVHNENGFILLGSPNSETTPIFAVYIYPEKRNGSLKNVLELLKQLPPKRYRVRCHYGQTFWKRVGLQEIRIENKNWRKRNIYVLEGTLDFSKCLI